MLIEIDNQNINETKNKLKNFIVNATPQERKKFIMEMNDKEFKKFYKFIIQHKIAPYFMGRNTLATFLLNTNGKYINYLYSLLMTNYYIDDFSPFFEFYGINKSEKEQIMKLFYIDLDYKEKEKPVEYIKNIINEYYSIEDVLEYFYMKYNDMKNCRLYKLLKHAFLYIKNNPNAFDPNDKLFDLKVEKAYECKFDTNKVNKILQLTKTSLEPVIGLDVNRYKGSTITSPTRTTALPLTKTVVEPVIETPSCVSPVDGCVCLSHLSPTRTTALPLTKTSLEPEIDFLGGYGEWLEQTSPTRTTALDI